MSVAPKMNHTPTEAPLSPSPAAAPVHPWADRLAPVCFWLAAFHLVAFAGLIHRAIRWHVTGTELDVLGAILVALWPLMLGESLAAFAHRDRARKAGPALLRVLAVAVFPPMRMGILHPTTGKIWLPGIGWQAPGKGLLRRLDRAFGLPLLLLALLILPILGIEYIWAKTVEESPAFELVLNVGMALIWVAFAAEFIIKLEASGHPLKYAKEKWVDAAIVLLPTLEFALFWWTSASPLARLLRSTRAIAPDQLARMGRVYRLRGLLVKGWHALLALELFARLLGDNPQKRLVRLESKIAVAQLELDELAAEAEVVRRLLALQKPDGKAPANDRGVAGISSLRRLRLPPG